MVTVIRLALDWTPNSNHIGFYVALSKGWYEEAGISLEIQSPSQDYLSHETPARKLVNNEVDFCIAPSESLISSWTSDSSKIKPIAVAAVLQNDTSAIVSQKKSGIDSPKSLDGKKYASYQGRFEMGIVRQMIINDGGIGTVIEVNPPKLDCFEAILRGEADSTWIFLFWEGLIAKRDGIELNEFKLSESRVPYGYSPLLLAHPNIAKNTELITKFLKISERGYIFANDDPVEASKLFLKSANHHSLDKLGLAFVTEATVYLANGGHYLSSNRKWGIMESQRWEAFINWLFANDLLRHRDGSLVLHHELPIHLLFDNSFLN